MCVCVITLELVSIPINDVLGRITHWVLQGSESLMIGRL